MKTKLSIDDVLAKEDTKTFQKADAKEAKNNELQDKAKQLDSMREKAGRPKKSDEEKAKRYVIYWNDEDFAEIEKMAKLYNMKPLEWVKFAVSKEIRRERGV